MLGRVEPNPPAVLSAYPHLAVPTRPPACPAGASPDYMFLLQRLMMDNPDAAVNLAKMVAKQVDGALGLAGCGLCGRAGGVVQG